MLNWLRSRRATSEIRAHIPILPGLRAQLEQTTREMESAVVQICGSFQGMAETARATVQDSAPAGLDEVLGRSRETIERLLQRMESNTDLSLRAVQRIEAVELALKSITGALADVEKIAFANRMLALNAKIEAVHVGEAGAGFGIVADEISAQAGKSSEITDAIGETVKKLGTVILGATAELREMASTDRRLLAASRADVHEAVEALGQAHSRMEAALDDTRSRNEQLAADVSRAVTNLQFQDRLGQRIGHVNEALEQMEQSFRRVVDGRDEVPGDRHLEVMENLTRSFTMADERTAMAGGSEEANGDDVELF